MINNYKEYLAKDISGEKLCEEAPCLNVILDKFYCILGSRLYI